MTDRLLIGGKEDILLPFRVTARQTGYYKVLTCHAGSSPAHWKRLVQIKIAF